MEQQEIMESQEVIEPQEIMEPKEIIIFEYKISFKKFMLLTIFYANEPNNPEPLKQLSISHLAAMKQAELIQEGLINNLHNQVNPERIMEDTTKLFQMLEYFKEVNDSISSIGIRYSESEQNSQLLKSLNERYPKIKIDQLDECRKLVEYMELLKRGISFEIENLIMLKEAFESIPNNIKAQYNLAPFL